MVHTLKIENLHVSVEGKPILRGVNLVIGHGETHALMDLTARERVRSAWRLWGTQLYDHRRYDHLGRSRYRRDGSR